MLYTFFTFRWHWSNMYIYSQCLAVWCLFIPYGKCIFLNNKPPYLQHHQNALTVDQLFYNRPLSQHLKVSPLVESIMSAGSSLSQLASLLLSLVTPQFRNTKRSLHHLCPSDASLKNHFLIMLIFHLMMI